MDLYELCTFIVFVSLGTIGLMILLKLPSGTFDHISDERNGIIGLGFLLSALALIKFDTVARKRENEKFSYDLQEYEMIRTKFLEMEAAKLEMEKEYSIQYMTSSNGTVIVNPGELEPTVDKQISEQSTAEE